MNNGLLTSSSFVPPPLPPRGRRDDGLTSHQRHAMVGGIVAVHLVAVWGLLQVREVREAVADVAPIFVSLLQTPEPPKPVPPPPQVVPKPLPKTPPPVLVAAAPTAVPSAFVVPEPPPVPQPPAPPPPVPVVAAPTPPAPAPTPRIIPASAVDYLGEPPSLEYPRLSQKLGETGRVLLRIFIDEGGMPRTVQVEHSSGHARLDDAAVSTMRRARFKPPTLNGQPISGYALVPVDYTLEK